MVGPSSPPQTLSPFNTFGVHVGLGTYSGNRLANGGLPPALPSLSDHPFEPASIYLAGPGGDTTISYTGQECGGGDCSKPGPSGEVPLTNFYPQKQTLWCWAAVSEMLMENSPAHEHHDQCEQASKRANGTVSYCCPDGGDAYLDPQKDLNLQFPGCNAGDYVPSTLARFSFQVRTAGVLPLYGSVMTLQQIQQQISCKHHLVGFSRSDNVSPFRNFKRFLHPTRHDMIIYGYVGDLLMIYDPGLDAKTKITYDYFQDPAPFRLIEAYYEVNKMP